MDAVALLCMRFARVQDETDAGVVLHRRAPALCEHAAAWPRASDGASIQVHAAAAWATCLRAALRRRAVFREGSRRRFAAAGRMGLGPKRYWLALFLS